MGCGGGDGSEGNAKEERKDFSAGRISGGTTSASSFASWGCVASVRTASLSSPSLSLRAAPNGAPLFGPSVVAAAVTEGLPFPFAAFDSTTDRNVS